VGRLEVPKDPALAVQAFAALVREEPDEPWAPDDVARRITLRGRLGPPALAEARARSGTFLMMSHAGYEGFPRVLVEAMAAGLPPVVTEGSDTGRLIAQGVSGYVCGRDPAALDTRSARPGTSTAPRSPTPSPTQRAPGRAGGLLPALEATVDLPTGGVR
jgi:glycosyltransferase involved in cell wall biosynthesis